MLINDKKRTAVLKKSDTVTTNGGFILIADTPKHQSLIFSFFGSHPDCWKMIKIKRALFLLRNYEFQENAEQKQLMYELMQMGAQWA